VGPLDWGTLVWGPLGGGLLSGAPLSGSLHLHKDKESLLEVSHTRTVAFLGGSKLVWGPPLGAGPFEWGPLSEGLLEWGLP
jgi:hypothetical protein